MRLLCAASGRLGGPDRPFRVRDRLVDLGGLVARGRPGTDDEHVGLFHQTLADWLFDPSHVAWGIDSREPCLTWPCHYCCIATNKIGLCEPGDLQTDLFS